MKLSFHDGHTFIHRLTVPEEMPIPVIGDIINFEDDETYAEDIKERLGSFFTVHRRFFCVDHQVKQDALFYSYSYHLIPLPVKRY